MRAGWYSYYNISEVLVGVVEERDIASTITTTNIIHKIASLDPSLLYHHSEYIPSMLSSFHHNVNIHTVPSPPSRAPNPNLAPRHQPLPHTPHPYICLPDPDLESTFSLYQEQRLHFICQCPRCSARMPRVPSSISKGMGTFN
jgi:hypothetical protein